MRAIARARLDFGRARVEAFDLADEKWWSLLESADAVVSSLAVHHLDGPAKQRLFAAVAERLSPRGALLIADLVAPQRQEAHEVFASGWDLAAVRQATRPEALAQFKKTEWNIFWHPDPLDMPSPLFDQLRWLHDAGFRGVDCFWQRAGHAIYGGYRSAERAASGVLPFGEALRAAELSLA
jgi:SAM-dependent methyltransferase